MYLELYPFNTSAEQDNDRFISRRLTRKIGVEGFSGPTLLFPSPLSAVFLCPMSHAYRPTNPILSTLPLLARRLQLLHGPDAGEGQHDTQLQRLRDEDDEGDGGVPIQGVEVVRPRTGRLHDGVSSPVGPGGRHPRPPLPECFDNPDSDPRVDPS